MATGFLIIFAVLAVLLVGGGLMILLRTARKPEIPDTVKPQPYEDDDA